MYRISIASSADVEPITTLLQANSVERGGSLTGHFSNTWVHSMVESGMPIVVAYRGSYLAGVLFSAAMDAPSQSPAVIAMRETWSGQTGAYIYGPVCVAPTERGQGLLVKMYASLVDQLPNREAVLFIRQDNIASIRAHKSLGMHQVAQFRFDDNEYLIFSDSKLPPA